MIRDAVDRDLPVILAIYNDEVVNTTSLWVDKPFTLKDRKEWFETKRQAGYPVLVYEDQGIVMGFATYGPFRPHAGYRYTVEHSVYVDRHHRGKGVGLALLEQLIYTAASNEYKTMVAGIDASNETSIKLHLKLGFRHSGTIDKAGTKFGRWLDLAFYQLDLPGPKLLS